MTWLHVLAYRVRKLSSEHRLTGVPFLDSLIQDVRFGVRMLRKSPGFTAVALLSLALGVGANTALFSLIDKLLLRTLPVSEPDRLVQVQEVLTTVFGIKKGEGDLRREAFEFLSTHNEIFSDVVAFTTLDRPAVTIDAQPEASHEIDEVSANFFSGLGIAPVIGHIPSPHGASENGAHVAVLNYRFWRTRFGASPSVLGRILNIDGRAVPIIGVAPPRFIGLSLESAPDIWISGPTLTAEFWKVVGRLKTGVTAAAARAAVEVLLSRLDWERGGTKGAPLSVRVVLSPAGGGLSRLREQYERPLLALTVLVTLVLLITCVNIASLLTVRNSARSRELTVRIALGAPRRRVIMQLLIENVLLVVTGGAVAVLVAKWGVALILSMLPFPAAQSTLGFQIDPRVLVVTTGISVFSGLLFALAPTLHSTKVDLIAGLKAGQGSTAAPRNRRLGRVLIAGQVGLSVVLLVGAGLFVRTLENLTRTVTNFNPDTLLQVSIDTPGSGYEGGQVSAVYKLLLERILTIAGVKSVTGVRNPVMQGATSMRVETTPGQAVAGSELRFEAADVGPQFFETMNIRVLRGRSFSADDFARDAIVVNESFARRYFPNESPVGKRIGDPPGTEIIGVVQDSKFSSARKEIGPMAYSFALRNDPDRVSALEVRTVGDATAIARAVQQEVRRVNPRLLVAIRTMRQEIERSIAQERIVAAISAFFSVLGLVLACIGLFGVASYTVALRTNELGIRIALGAGRWNLIRESLRDTMQIFIGGLAAGTVVAITGVRLVASAVSDLLFGLTATDPSNLIVAALLMVAVVIVACLIPAHRATRIDPLTAIRYE